MVVVSHDDGAMLGGGHSDAHQLHENACGGK